MATIGELIINLNANTASFVTELDRVKNLSFSTAKQVERSFSLIGTAALGMISVAAAAFAVGIDKTAEWEVHILHLAQSAGTSVESMSGLAFAAKMMGLEVDQIAKALERFDKQMLQAQLGNAKAAQNMSLLGIDPKLIKTSDDALLLLAEHFSKLPDGALKSGEAMMAFGKAGAEMVPLLNLGAKGIQDFLDEAKRMGVVITKEQAEDAEAFEQNITRMKESLHGLWVEITNATLPVMNDFWASFSATKQKEGFGGAMSELLDVMQLFSGPTLDEYMHKGMLINDAHAEMAKKVKDVTLAVNDDKKAFDALQKSTEAILVSLRTQIATFGQSAMAVQEYKIRTDAAKIGQSAWAEAEIKLYERLQKKKNLLDELGLIDNQTKEADQDDLAAMQAQLDVMLRMDASQFTPTSDIGAWKATQAFTDAINQESAAVEHSIAVFGMSADEITRFDLAQLDGSVSAQMMIDKLIAEQDQLAAMQEHAKSLQNAWKSFGDIADRSLNELIFSGKKFTQVLADVTKQLGEMFLKWALFGFGDKNSSGGGGLFGSLFGALFGSGGGLGALFGGGGVGVDPFDFTGFAAGGAVSAGVPIMVGENGPEIFTPSTAGAIIPNGGGGGGSQVNIVYNIDARGSSITEEQFRRSLAESEGRAVHRALLTTREMQLRTA